MNGAIRCVAYAQPPLITRNRLTRIRAMCGVLDFVPEHP